MQSQAENIFGGIVHKLLFLVLFFGLAGQAVTAQNITRRVAVQDNWGSHSGSWGNGGGLLIRFASFDRNGTVELCVAAMFLGASPSAANFALLKEASARIIGGKTIRRNLSFAKVHSSRHAATRLVGLDAKCIDTKKPTPASLRTELVIRKGQYRYDK